MLTPRCRHARRDRLAPNLQHATIGAASIISGSQGRLIARSTNKSPFGGTTVLILNNDDVAKMLDMPLCLSALDAVFHECASGDAVGMGRIALYVLSGVDTAPYYRWAVMTG